MSRGVEATFLEMMHNRVKLGKSSKCFNASYLYALYGAVHDIDWRDVPEYKKQQFKELTASLRANYG